MLDQENRQAALVAQAADQVHHVFGFLRIHPGGWLVEQQQQRLGRQRPRDLQPPLQAIGRFCACNIADAFAQPDVFEQFHRPFERVVFLVPRAAQAEHRRDRMRVQARVHPDQHIFERGHAAEQADILVGAGDAALHDLVRAQPANRAPIEHDLPFFGRVKAGDAVEKSRFARAVRSDQAGNRAARNLQIDAAHRRQAAEALDHATHIEQNVAHRSCRLPPFAPFVERLRELARLRRDQALRLEQHRRHQQRPKRQQAIIRQFAQRFRQADQHQRADDHAGDRAQARR